MTGRCGWRGRRGGAPSPSTSLARRRWDSLPTHHLPSSPPFLTTTPPPLLTTIPPPLLTNSPLHLFFLNTIPLYLLNYSPSSGAQPGGGGQTGRTGSHSGPHHPARLLRREGHRYQVGEGWRRGGQEEWRSGGEEQRKQRRRGSRGGVGGEEMRGRRGSRIYFPWRSKRRRR